mgnify:CR=1 FL=1
MLKLENVKVSYGAIEAVKGVSLEVGAGEVVTIIGANGAGTVSYTHLKLPTSDLV